MKKILSMLLILMFSLTLVVCGKTTYTKEFTYLPSQKTITLKNFQKPTKTKMGVCKYIVKNKKSADAIADYKKVLTKDGWKTTETKNTASVITATKGSHIVAIVPT